MNNFKKLLLLFFFALSINANAQMRNNRREKIETMKIGFLTDRLDLSPDEAKAFWPVYNNYSDDLEQLRKTRRENILDAQENINQMSNADLEKAVDNEIISRQSELDLLKKYHPQFKQVLPIKKVALLYQSEEAFKRRLLEILKDRREGGMRPGRM